MRVLLVNDQPPGGTSGAEVHLQLLADSLRQAGDEVEIVGPDEGRRVRALDLWDPGAARRVAERVEAFAPAVVHHHNVLRELSPAVFTATRDVPSVLTVHDHRLLGVADAATDGSLRRRAVTVAAALARHTARRYVTAVVAVDDSTAQRLEAHGFGQVTRLELFARDPGAPAVSACDSTDVVFAGRLAADKGALDLVTAFVAIAPRHPAAHLTVVGDGPQRAAIESLAADHPGRIQVRGAVAHAEALDLMAGARVVAVPSVASLRPETGPQTVLEAALRARPVITTDGIPLAALLRRCDGGVVVPPGDLPALAAALERFLGDPTAAREAGERARAAALARHTPEAVVPDVRALYARLAGGAAA
jgi:glycosyltransferase involved in cell wall biosynthesis